jgi:hypothetical protein
LQSIPNYFFDVYSSWRDALKEKSFRWKLLLTPGLFFVYSAITQSLGNYVEMRKGVQLDDQLLQLFPRMDFSLPVFLLLYTSLSLVVLTHLKRPGVILRIIEMHFAVAVVRQLCILAVALDPPAGIIVLRDLFLENTVYPRHSPLTKDLFFSGHVASIWIYFLCAEKRWLRYYLLFATIAMSFMILSMRVHYTYDVYGALIFTSLIYFAPVRVRSYLESMNIIRQSSGK